MPPRDPLDYNTLPMPEIDEALREWLDRAYGDGDRPVVSIPSEEELEIDEDSLSDDQLSRLGINNTIPSTPSINYGSTTIPVFDSYGGSEFQITDGVSYRNIHLDTYVQGMIDVKIARLETRMVELEEEIRRMREENGQDNS